MLAAQARARVLIYSKTLAHVRAAAAVRQAESLRPPSPFSRIAAVARRFGGRGRMSIAPRLALLLQLLLALIALFRFRRGGIVRALQLLLRYKRR